MTQLELAVLMAQVIPSHWDDNGLVEVWVRDGQFLKAARHYDIDSKVFEQLQHHCASIFDTVVDRAPRNTGDWEFDWNTTEVRFTFTRNACNVDVFTTVRCPSFSIPLTLLPDP